MNSLCNTPENFTREIQHIIIYDADILTFNKNLKGEYPPTEGYLLKVAVTNISKYRRSVQFRKSNKNDYFKIDISLPFYDLSLENRRLLYSFHKKRKYLIVTASNKDMLVLGNHRERLSIEVLDNIDDDGGGNDHFRIRITGETTVYPQLRKVSPMFRVLLFPPPLK